MVDNDTKYQPWDKKGVSRVILDQKIVFSVTQWVTMLCWNKLDECKERCLYNTREFFVAITLIVFQLLHF
jgi:hypothetical protein